MQKLTTLHQVLIHQLKGLFSTEKRLCKAMPSLIGQAASVTLTTELKLYQANLLKRIHRLETAFNYLGEHACGRVDKISEEMIIEFENILSHIQGNDLRDAVLIGNLQKVILYKIADYGTSHSFAEELREHEVSKILKQLLESEKDTDTSLTVIALSEINENAYNVRMESMF